MQLSERQVVGTACASHATVHIIEQYIAGLIAVPALMMVDFNADYAQMGRAATPLFLFFGLTAPLAGLLAGRIGSYRTLSIYLLGAAVTFPLIALSQNLVQLSFAFGALGFFMGLYHPAGLSGISRLSRRTGPALGWHGFSGNIGLAIGPFMGVFLAANLGLGWRWSYACLFVPVFLLGLYTLYISRHEARTHTEVEKKQRFAERADIRGLLILLLIAVINGIIYRMVLMYLPAHLTRVFNGSQQELDPMTGTLITSGFLIVGSVGQLGSGHLSERFSVRSLLAVVYVVSGVSLLVIGKGGMLLVVIAGVLFGLFFFATQTLTNSMISRLTPRKWHTVVYGLNSFLTFGVGSLGAWVGGVTAEHWDMSTIYIFAGVVSFGLALLPLMLPRHRMESHW